MAFSDYALKSLLETPALPRCTDAAVCAGRESHKTPLIGAAHTLEDISHRSAPSAYVLDSLRETRALKQLGTLGGGNHFLEVQIALINLQNVIAPAKGRCQQQQCTASSVWVYERSWGCQLSA